MQKRIGPEHGNNSFNLKPFNNLKLTSFSNAYYLLLADGPTKKVSKTQIGISLDYHSGGFGASSSSIKFSDFAIVGESDAVFVKV